MSIERQVIIHFQVCTKAKMASTLAIQTLGKSNGNVTNATSYFRISNCLEIIRLDRTPINQFCEIQIPYQILLLIHSNVPSGKNKHNFCLRYYSESGPHCSSTLQFELFQLLLVCMLKALQSMNDVAINLCPLSRIYTY